MNRPRVTAAITGPADESALGATLDRLQAQEGVDLDVIVVDSSAATSPPGAAAPPGMSVRRLHCAGGEREALDHALAEARTELVTFLRPGDRPRRGAFARVAAAVADNPAVRLAHGCAFGVDAAGRIPKLVLREQAARVPGVAAGTLDHRRARAAGIAGIGALPTYRRSALLSIGGFAAGAGTRPHDDAALRLLDAGEVLFVPDMLCGSPAGPAPARRSPGTRAVLRSFARRWLRRARRIRRRIGFAGMLAAGFGAGRLYPRLTALLRWWPVGRATAAQRAGPQRIAYVLWHYPILSETFIRREIQALRGLGFDIDIVADAPEAVEPDPASPTDAVLYLEPVDRRRRRLAALRLLRRRPIRLLDRAVFIASRRYGPGKTLAEDMRTLSAAADLAGVLEQRGITHVHAPWADRHAFIALVAARLAGASFSLNLRAHEVHSRHYAFALTEKIAAARFAVTNSRYNHSRLNALAGPVARNRVHVIYNGLDLERFESGLAARSDAAPRLLSVGRLVEQKGFDRLLEACALLRDRGVAFRCDVIGGAAEPAETATAVCLRIQHRRLGLEDRVRFLGAQPLSRVLAALDEADVFVLSCVVTPHGGRDVTPNALLEAMAMRRAVISTPVGAIPELVDDGVNGILVPPGDPVALADAIERLLADPLLRQRLGDAARRKVEERFDIRRNIGRYGELFRDAVR